MKSTVLVSVIFLVGCVNTAKNLDYVSVGMSKSAVIYVLGEPAQTKTGEGVEYLTYRLRSAPGAEAQAGCGAAGIGTMGLAYLYKGCQFPEHDYLIVLKQGKVTAFGRSEIFDPGM